LTQEPNEQAARGAGQRAGNRSSARRTAAPRQRSAPLGGDEGEASRLAGSAQPAAPAVEANFRDQWQEIDSVLNSLAQRSRSRRLSGEDDDEIEEPRARTSAGSSDAESRLRASLEAVTRERDQLRAQLASTQRELRSARAELRLPSEDSARPQPGPDRRRRLVVYVPFAGFLWSRNRPSTGPQTARPSKKS
jgi:hypothetical protein